MEFDPRVKEAMGDSLWKTDLFLPTYRLGEMGSWKIIQGQGVGHDWGYYSGPVLMDMLPSLLRKVSSTGSNNDWRWEIWMSLTPHEIESQELGCRLAHGHVVIMGLGMGWIAANVALNPEVTRVTIVELDSEVIGLFENSGAFDSLPREVRGKVEIVNGNALDWRPEVPGSVDFLYADIWLSLAEPEALDQVRQMQKNIQAGTVYYWGQEIAIYSAVEGDLSIESIELAINEKIHVPLLVPDDRDYPEMIKMVISNRIQRGRVTRVEV